MYDFLDFGLTFFSIICSCTITSKAKINIFWKAKIKDFWKIFYTSQAPSGPLRSKKFQKTLILAFQKTLILAFEVIVQLPEYK